MKILYSLLFVLLSLVANNAFSQTGTMPGADSKTKPDDKSNDGTSSFKFSLNYSSNNVYLGRTDSVRTPILTPQAKFTLKNGIYFSGTLDIIPGRKKRN